MPIDVVLLIATGVAAVTDWSAVARDHRALEVLAKPATLALLLAAALVTPTADPAVRIAIAVGLAASLVGDVCLLVPERGFVPGLAAFLVGHVAYAVGFRLAGGALVTVAIAAGVLAVVGAPIARRIVAGASPRLRAPITAYLIAITVMVATAVATGSAAAIAGALLFYVSDAILGWNRFVRPVALGRVAVHVPYHLGQVLIVLALR